MLRATHPALSAESVAKRRKSGNTGGPTVTLANGLEMPVVGLGTSFFPGGQHRPETTWSVLPVALDAGYSHIDTAHLYGNESQVRDVLSHYFIQGRLGRDDVFICTKVAHPPIPPMKPESVAWETQYVVDPDVHSGVALTREFYGCLERLGLGYVDLLLIHAPGPQPTRFPEFDRATHSRRKRKEMWTAMEDLYKRGVARAIGVSNFSVRHLQELEEDGCKTIPHVNQVEMSPYLSQAPLRKYCSEKGVVLTAHSPLGQGRTGITEDPEIVRIAKEKACSASQLILRWLIQKGVTVVPKSSSAARIAENLAAASLEPLTEEQMAAMDALDRGLRTCPDWDQAL